ncbi:hypothetical protein SAMN02910356_01388 [Selenomonas sp. GACV-9]|uniref:hypothetical protein n=1 Tax=Selenomonas sp. GACV-9 TaxID=3158782 RepID=UPI0008E84250|nr:hypothetical protein SAMN02910356_01388 [Selenomonas ruminantium]
MMDVKRPVREALEHLKERQAFESSYAEINKVQALINTFANLDYACDLMAQELAEKTGQSRDEVLADFYRRVGILDD